MTATPWGSGDDLRAGHPRKRLLAATVVAVAEQGYEETAVADLLALTGISRATFYRHFDDKQACFLATYDALMDGALAAIRTEVEGKGAWDERLEAGFARLLDLIAAYPAAAHLCLLDVHAAGPEALRRAQRTIVGFTELLERAFGEAPQHSGLPLPVLHAILGGVYKVVASRVRRGAAVELPGIRPAIQTWALSYRTPPGAIRRQRTRRPDAHGPDFRPYGTVGRIYDAVALEVAEHGYAATTIDAIAGRAGVSAHTFYKHFDGKQDALLATYEAGTAQAYAFTQPAVVRDVEWPQAFRAALQAMFTFLAGNAAWTRMAVLGMPTAGPAAIARLDEEIDRFAMLLAPAQEQAPGMGEIAAEATAGAIYAVHYNQIRKVGPERLLEIVPACAFAGLAPFIGAEQALEVANGGSRAKNRRAPAA